MAANNDLTVLEQTQISPLPGAFTGDQTIPLSFQDIPWLLFHPIHQLCFFEFPHPNFHFINTIIPNLKHSLSITLHHFYLLAGNLIVFPFTDSDTTPRKPEIRYVDGDSVSFTVAESSNDFLYLTGNHARKANQFYPLVPKLGAITKNTEIIQVPLLAIQVTMFPNRGFCIGITNHHSACDGNARVQFLKVWASISKSGDDKDFLDSGSLPSFDRSVLKDPNGIGAKLWSMIAKTKIQESPPKHVSGNEEKVRSTFIMSRDQINKLKKWVLGKKPEIARLSSFTIVCAHVWICLAKLNKAVGEVDEREQFGFVADVRTRLVPPVPATFFGNCLTLCKALANRDELVGEEGFIKGVELMGEAIRERFKSEGSIFGEIDMKSFESTPVTAIGIAGSPKFDVYGTDFGWGKPKKCEIVSIDYGRVISLSTSSVSEEDIEVGLVLPKVDMQVFETIFINHLNKVLE